MLYKNVKETAFRQGDNKVKGCARGNQNKELSQSGGFPGSVGIWKEGDLLA
jgi:hypothetical protein